MRVAIPCSEIDCERLFDDWAWRLPPQQTPVMIGYFADTVFGAPDGSLWLLSLLDGGYSQIARDSAEFNILNKRPERMDKWFLWDWASMAIERGMAPGFDECLGWKVAPILGGAFAIDQIQIFKRRVYLSLQGQLHRQLSVREN